MIDFGIHHIYIINSAFADSFIQPNFILINSNWRQFDLFPLHLSWLAKPIHSCCLLIRRNIHSWLPCSFNQLITRNWNKLNSLSLISFLQQQSFFSVVSAIKFRIEWFGAVKIRNWLQEAEWASERMNTRKAVELMKSKFGLNQMNFRFIN